MPDMSGLMQPPYLNPTPDNMQAYTDLQKKQLLASLLTQSAQQSAQTPAEWNSMRVVPKRSGLANVATLASALMAGKAQNNLFGAQSQYLQGLMGGGNSSQPQAPSTPPLTGILPPTASTPGAAIPHAAPDAPQAPPPQQGSAAQNSMLIPGTDPATSQRMFMMLGPQEYGKILAGQYMPTDLMKVAKAAGLSQEQEQAVMRASIAKQTTNVENVRPGGTLFDVNKGAPIFNAPQNGQQISYGPNGAQVNLLPGAAGAAGTLEQAESTGKSLGSVVNVPQKGGGTMPALGASVLAPSARPAGAAPTTAPRVGTPSFSSSKQPTNFWSGLPTYETPSGVGAQSTESAKTSEMLPQVRAEKYQKFGTAAMDAGEQERNDVMALRNLGNATVGPESERVNNVKGVLNQFGLLPEKAAGTLSNSIELGKYLNNNALANARQKFGGGRLTNTDVTLSIEKLNPGTNMTDKAIYNLTVENMVRSAYAKQMANDFTYADKRLKADPQAFEQWYSSTHPLNDFANQHAPQMAQAALAEWKGGTAAAVQPVARTAPQVGEIIKGYRFKGGDPSKQENYELASSSSQRSGTIQR